MESPLVSVIVPTFNRPDYLKLTLQSVVQQTYDNIEIIVVDDGTPGDKNALLCNDFTNVTYIKINNSGSPCKPRNEGIKKSNGKYLAFLDDDDIWEPLRLELMVKILEENSEFGLVHCYCKLIDKNGNDLNQIVGRPGNPYVKHGDVSLRMIGNWTISDYPIARKTLIEKIGFFNESMKAAGEDVEYWVRASFYTMFYYLDKPLTNYRKHSENNSISNSLLYIDLNLKLKDVIKVYFENEIISRKTYKICLQNLVRNQIKMIKSNWIKNLTILYKLNLFWMMKFENLKLLMFVMIYR